MFIPPPPPPSSNKFLNPAPPKGLPNPPFPSLPDSGGKDGRKRTYAIEQDACRHFIRAATALPQVNTFLMTSLIGARRDRAPWWTDAEWERLRATRYVSGVRRYYGAANLAADECLTAAARKRGSGFRALVLRLGSLTDEKKEEKVALGKTRAIGTVGRTAVTRVAVELLERAKTSAWLDLLEGDETVEDAVKRVVDEGVDCIEGEDVEALMEREAKIDAEKSRTKSVTANGENLRLNFGHDHVFS